MSIKGFDIEGTIHKYDFNALDNKPEDFGNKNVVMVQDERPTESGNRVWVKETAAEIEIPTSSEFEELRENIVVVSSDTPTSDDNRIWIEPEDGDEIQVPTMDDLSSSSKVFWAIYNVTTSDEIVSALADEKIVALNYENRIYYLASVLSGVGPTGTAYLFRSEDNNANYQIMMFGSYWNPKSTIEYATEGFVQNAIESISEDVDNLKSALELNIDGLNNGKRYMEFMRGNIAPNGSIDTTYTNRIVTAEYEKFATATDVIFSAGFGYIVAFYNDDYSLASRTLYSGANTITFPANTFYRVCVYGNEAGPDKVEDWAVKVYWISEIQKNLAAFGYSNSVSLDITNYVKRFENLGIKQGERIKLTVAIDAVGSGAKNVQIFANTILEANLLHTFYGTSDILLNAPVDLNTIVVLLNTAGSLTSVDVTATLQTGYFILASENRYIYHVEKDGTGDFTSLVEAINVATQTFDSVVYVGAGTWDIIEELGETYLNNVSSTHGTRGPYLKNRVHVIFASNSKVVCNYQGSREETMRWLSPFNSGELGFTLENANIEASNVRYCVHDERDSFDDAYTNKYINCKMHLNNNGNTVIRTCNPIGGGLGKDGYVEIDGCWFKGERTSVYTENLPLVTYHNSAAAGAKSHISLKNSYFADDGRPRFNWYGQSQLITDVEVCGCSMGSPILSQAETSDGSSPYQNINIIEWNNTVRT